MTGPRPWGFAAFTLLLLLLLLLSCQTRMATARKNLILDTDIFSDCDDTAAIQLAATSPDVKLLAVNVNTRSAYSALAVSAILAHYGHEDTPVGAPGPLLTDEVFFDDWGFELGEFASKVARHWSGGTLPWGRAADAWDPVELYRKQLAASEDGSVTIASLGFLGNLAGLLDSQPDGHSELDGAELVLAKVSELVVMGGEYPSGREWNFCGCRSGGDNDDDNDDDTRHSKVGGDNPSAAAESVVNGWPGRMVFSGLELGVDIFSGARLVAEGPASDPVRAAFFYHAYGRPRRSWDPVTVLYAIRGLSDVFEYANDDGYNRVAPDGSNAWVDDGRVRNQHWLKLRLDAETVGHELDRLYLEAAWMAENPFVEAAVPRAQRYPKHPSAKAEL